MPHKREYQCLNPNCTSNTNPYRAQRFTAMNDAARCPHCSSIKLHDHGTPAVAPEAPNVIGSQARADIKQSNGNLRRIAERYGMTNMSNKDGKGVKANAPSLTHSGPTTKVGGIDVPVDMAAGGACLNLPSMAAPLNATWSGAKGSNMLAGMTNVVGKHE